jgi:hypothetical protein
MWTKSVVIAGILIAASCAALTAGTLGGNIAPDGTTPVQIDLPQSLRLRNKVGTNRAGLCVFTSCEMAAEWQNVDQLFGFRDFMTKYAGGAGPARLDQMVDVLCKQRKLPKPRYIHVISADLEIIKTALRSGRLVCITYSKSVTGRYGGRIAHMVNCPHAGVGNAPDGKGFWAVLDNNYIDKLEWLSEREFRDTACYPGGRYWAVIFQNPSPPPRPVFFERSSDHVAN